jgi:hypothetical protein
LQFTSWWVENGEKNNIVIVFRLDGQPHEIIIKDTKYYVKELYSADKRNTTQLAVSIFSLSDHFVCSAGTSMLVHQSISSARPLS